MTSRPGGRNRRRRAEVERRPPPPMERVRGGFSLGFWTALLVGAWLGRASVALPAGLDGVFDLLLPLAAAVFVVISYRRWIRARMAATVAAREARERARQRSDPPA